MEIRPGHHVTIKWIESRRAQYWWAHCDGCGEGYLEARKEWVEHWVSLHQRRLTGDQSQEDAA